MANTPIEESLSLDISSALQGISQLDDALQQVTTTFAVGLSSALETLTGAGADITPLAESLDVAGLGPAVDAALSEAGATPIPLEADTEAITAGIADATDVAPLVPIDADTSSAQAAIGELAAEPIELEVDADTTPAQESISDLGGAAGQAGSELDQLSGGVEALSASTGLAKGEVGALGGFISNISPAAAEAVTGIAAVTAIIGASSSVAADAQAQNERFTATFGDLADRVQQIDIGGLSTDFAELGRQSGTANADIEATASRIGQLGQKSGAADQTIVSTTQTLVALGAVVAVNNPRLGDAAAVTDKLGTAFAKNGRGLAAFGIGLSGAQITAEALRQTGKATADELTQFEKITAGATLAAAQFGDTLGDKFASGSQNAQVQLRALKTQVEETLVTVGLPLLGPLVQSLSSAVPVVEQVGLGLGNLANIFLSLTTAVAPVLGPISAVLSEFTTGLGSIAESLDGIPGPVLAVATAFGVLAIAGRAAATAFVESSLVFAASPLGAAVIGIGGAVALLGVFSDQADQASADTSLLAGAFGQLSASGDEVVNTLGGVNATIKDYLDKQLLAGDAGERAIDAANRIGVSNAEIVKGLQLSGQAYDEWRAHVVNAAASTKGGEEAADALFDTLEEGRAALQASASAALAAAVANGALTQSEVDLLLARNTRKFTTDEGTKAEVDYITVLEKEAGKIDQAAKARQVEAKITTFATNAVVDLAQAVAAGTVTAKDATEQAEKLGLAEDQVKEFIEDLTKAFGEQADQSLLASAAAQQLRLELARGQISAADAEVAFVQMGVSVGGAKDAIDNTTAAIQSFISEALGALPDAGASLGAFNSDLISAIKGVQTATESAVKGRAKAIKAANAEVTEDLNPQRLLDALNLQILTIAAFQQNIDTLIERGRINLAAALIAEGPDQAGLAAQQLVSNDTLAKATDAGFKFGAQVRAGFRDDLLAHRPELAGVLVTLADGSVVDASQLVTESGAKIGQALITGIATPINASKEVKDAVQRLAEGGAAAFDPNLAAPSKDAAVKAGQDAQAGFKEGFDPAGTATAQVGKVPAAITTGITPAVTAATVTGVGLTDAFAGQLHFAGQVTAHLETVAERFTRDDGPARVAAAAAGFALGAAYGEGFAGGLTSEGSDVSDAAGALASTADDAVRRRLGIASPSKAGITIGEQYVAGIAQGLSALSPVERATAALTLALVPDLRPVLRQTPQLASGIVQASPVLAGASPDPLTPDASVSTRLVKADITLNKTDPDPKHFADELAWMLQ